MRKLDTHPELLVLPVNSGVKLIPPDEKGGNFDSGLVNIGGLMELSCCAYFTNADSATQIMNEQAAAICNFNSPSHAVGKTMYDVSPRKVAELVIGNHQTTMRSKNFFMFEEDILDNKGFQFQCITTLLPWFRRDNKIEGILGFSIVIGSQPLADTISQLIEIGLLKKSKPAVNKLHHPLPSNIYLSKREKQCLQFYVQGKTVREIALILNLSKRTVEHYIENIKNKMGVSTKYDLIMMCQESANRNL